MIGSMKHRRTAVSVSAILAGMAAMAASAILAPSDLPGQEVSPVASGAAVYGDMCGRCHNPRSPLERSDRDWVTIVNHMRIRGNLTGNQVRQVLAFLQATNSDPGRVAPSGGVRPPAEYTEAPIQPELADAGRDIVAARACFGCHLIAGKGANVGPALDGVTDRRSPDFLRRKLEDPTFDKPASMMPNFDLTREEIEAVLAYLATLD